MNPVDGFMTVRQSDAHALAEVWAVGRGWIRVDPASGVAPVRIEQGLRELTRQAGAGPLFSIGADSDAGWVQVIRRIRFNWEAVENSWNQWVLGYSAQRQMSLLDHLGFEPDWRVLDILLALGVSIVAAALAVVSLRTVSGATRSPSWRRASAAGLSAPGSPASQPTDCVRSVRGWPAN